ncbi:class I SAM-dependent methyltransferase [Methylomagnum sp.]
MSEIMAGLNFRGWIPYSIRALIRETYFKATSGVASARITKAIEAHSKQGVPLKLMIGAGGLRYPGWIATDIYTLDILKAEDWDEFLNPGSIDRLLAEHVLEHLSMEQNRIMLGLAYDYLKPGGVFRIAVPDGNREDIEYVAEVAPPKDGHQVFFTFESLAGLLESVGFQVEPLEYFDAAGSFHAVLWNSEDGHINRSVRFDKQESMRVGNLRYTSLIVDARKPA